MNVSRNSIRLTRSLLLLLLLPATDLRSQPEDLRPSAPPPAPQIVTIDEAVAWALARHPQFSRDSAEIEVGNTSVRAAFGSFLPAISLRGGYLKYLNDVGTVTGGIELEARRPSTELSGGAAASLELFDGFARSAAYNAAGHERDAAALLRVAHQVEIAWEVRRAFLELLRAEAAIEVTRAGLATLRTERERLADRIAAGVALRSETDLFDAEIAMAEYELLLAENSRESLLNRLITAMNFDPARRIEVSSAGVPIDLPPAQIERSLAALGDEQEVAEELLDRRSDIAALRSALLAAEQRVTVAEAGYYPSIGASLGVNHYRSGPINQTTGTLGINLQYTIFDQFRTDELVARAEAGLLNARLDLRQRELDVRSELSAARSRLEGATRLLAASRVAAEAARTSRQTALTLYEEGIGPYGEVLRATERFVEARIGAITAAYDWWTAYFDVLRVQGDLYPDR